MISLWQKEKTYEYCQLNYQILIVIKPILTCIILCPKNIKMYLKNPNQTVLNSFNPNQSFILYILFKTNKYYIKSIIINTSQIQLMEQRQQQVDNHFQIIYSPNKISYVEQNKPLQNKHSDKRQTISTQDAQLLQQFINRFIISYLNQDLELANLHTKFVKQKITPLSHLHAQAYSQILQAQVIKKYLQRLKWSENKQPLIVQSLQVFMKLMKIYKDNSVNPIIINVSMNSFKQIWKKYKSQKGAYSQEVNNKILNLWRYIPYQFIKQFLEDFDLLKGYQKIKMEEFFSYMSKLFFQNKIQQGCEYYRLYKLNQTISKEDWILFQKFQYEQLLPRITKKDHIFSDFVVNLIKNDSSIFDKVFQCIEIKQCQKLVKLTGKNIEDYPKIILYAMKKHYKDVVRRSKEWYIIEDKICYSLDFVEWFIQDLSKKYKKTESDSESQEGKENHKNDYFIESEQDRHLIVQSIRKRANILNQVQNYIENPLYQHDEYIPTEFIFAKINNKNQEQQYLTLQSLDITPQNIYFLDKIDERFLIATKQLLYSQIVGFDTQFWATTSKFEEGGTSIIQLATHRKCYIFDYQALKKQLEFQYFFTKLMSNSEIIKLGHTIQSDVKLLLKSFKRQLKLEGVIDLTHLIKHFYKNQVYSSLAFMSQKFLGKKMCKYEQRSNWNRRPLKKTQTCYACLDALACIHIYQKMQKENGFNFKKILKIFNSKNQRQTVKQIVQQKFYAQKKKEEKEKIKPQKVDYEFDFNKYKDYLSKPIFLVDNMLKKLCSTMRNCGLDAEFISVKDYQLATSQSKRQKRILITRDSKLIQNKYSNFAIYFLKEKSDCDIMFKQILQAFHLDLNQFQTLSRCVKCNNHELLIIDKDEATKQIHFTYEDSSVQIFWRCTKCKQIYWQGGQFKKAKSKYEQLRK